MSATQKYLVTVQRLTACDECSVISSWSAVVADEDLKNFGGIADAARVTELALKDFPGTNVRPMTDEEIREWRDAERAEQD